MGQYLEKTRQDTYTLLKRNISSHLKGLRVVILSKKSARIVYITEKPENLKQNIIQALSTRFPLGVAGGLFSSARASVAEVQQTQNSQDSSVSAKAKNNSKHELYCGRITESLEFSDE